MLSIVIPTYNEQDTIKKTITSCINNATRASNIEFIIVDGQSSDQTQQKVNSLLFSKVYLFTCPNKGRSTQMNYGAKKTNGTIVYFLHADSIPPKGFDELIFKSIKNKAIAGCFRMKFDNNHWFLNFWCWFTRFNWNVSRGGDQSLFMKKETFNAINGYDNNLKIMEDIEIIKRLKKKGRFEVVPHALITSARKYETNGVFKLQFLFGVIHLQHILGFSQQKMINFYKKHIT